MSENASNGLLTHYCNKTSFLGHPSCTKIFIENIELVVGIPRWPVDTISGSISSLEGETLTWCDVGSAAEVPGSDNGSTTVISISSTGSTCTSKSKSPTVISISSDSSSGNHTVISISSDSTSSAGISWCNTVESTSSSCITGSIISNISETSGSTHSSGYYGNKSDNSVGSISHVSASTTESKTYYPTGLWDI